MNKICSTCGYFDNVDFGYPGRCGLTGKPAEKTDTCTNWLFYLYDPEVKP